MSLLTLMSEQKPRLLRFLTRRLGCEHAAKDVYQTVSESLIATPASRPINNPEAYLYRVAINAANSYRRASATRATYEAQAAQRSCAEPVDPEIALEAEHSLRVISEALDELPLLTKRMFLAFRVHGMRQQDIARRYGVSLSTVEKRIAKASLHCHRRLAGSLAETQTSARPQPTSRREGD